MDINWSIFDGVLGLILIGVMIWVALKIAKRLIIGAIVIVIIGVMFFGWHLGGFSRPAVENAPQTEDRAGP